MIHISAEAPALLHGVGLFETLRVLRGRALHVDEHFTRMRRSAEALGFDLPAPEAFARAIAEAVDAVDAREAAVRCAWLDGAERWVMAAMSGAIPAVTLRRRKLGRVVTLDRDLVRSLPSHKLTSYAVCVVGLRRAISLDADEGLFVDRRGRILEGTSTNVFAIARESLVTPPVRAGILPGVTRALVIAKAHAIGLRVVERRLTVDDLRGGSFLTGSLTTVAPIREVNGETCALPSNELLGVFRATTG